MKSSKILKYPDTSLYKLIEEVAKKYPNLIALNYFDNEITFNELIKKINETALAFKKCGVKKGDTITICMPNTPEAIYSFYALNLLGAVASMIHPLSAENEIEYYLNISNSKMILTIDIAYKKVANIIFKTKVKKIVVLSVKKSMPKILKTLYTITKERKIEKPVYNSGVLSWENFILLGTGCNKKLEDKNTGKDIATILYSGGTTGYPKGIVLTNLNFNAVALQSIKACDCLRVQDRVLSIMPIFHGFGLGICIHTIVSFGCTAVILPQFEAKTFDKLLKKYKPNIVVGVPTLFEALLRNKKIQKMDLSYIRCVISGGDSLSVSLKNRVDKFLNERNAHIQIREGYGLTECVTGSCLMPKYEYRDGSIGKPYPDMYYKIVKPNTIEELKENVDGEIVLRGPSVMKCYLNNPEETKKVLRKHEDGNIWLHTGDMGYIDKEGFIYFKQRIKRMIVSSGYNIYPQYIENIIDSHKDVLMSVVVGVKHDYKKEVPKAYVVLKNDIKPTDELKEDILNHCKKNLAKYSIPSDIEFRDSLPKTLVGKVAYTKLEEK